MPNWNQMLEELNTFTKSPHDLVRRKYLKSLSDITGRNVIIYYSGWLQKPELQRDHAIHFSVNDNDKNGFMSAISGLDKTKGLDLILHTPGGDIAATESLVAYLRSIFGNDIRAIVPQLAMSAGTMISCSCSEIIMGKHSSLGPIDPQISGVPAHGIIEEFTTAAEEIKNDQSKIYVWQPIIAKYSPSLIGHCQKAIDWSEEMVKEWLETGMLREDDDADAKADFIVSYLGSHAITKSHSRHISADKAIELGLKVTALEEDSKLQDAILSVHHATIHTLGSTNAIKVIENQEGTAFIQHYNN
jgi:ClpP class serine protease